MQNLRTIIISVLMLLSLQSTHAFASPPETVRVGLLSKAARCTWLAISSPKGIIVNSQDNSTSVSGDTRFELSLTGKTIYGCKTGLPQKPLSGKVTISPADSSQTVTLFYKNGTSRKLRGYVEIIISQDRLLPINVLPIESYLRGVVSCEMPAKSPTAALQAQAICARTYTYRNIRKHRLDDFDVCDTTHCQCYKGVSAETTETDRAVADTVDLVITFRNEIASVMYSSDSGGVTQDYAELRGSNQYPYLTAVVDPVEIPHKSWTVTYTLSEIESKLISSGVKGVKDLLSMYIFRTGVGGRVLTVMLETKSGQTEIVAEKLRSALGVNDLKSTLFTLDSHIENQVTFSGRGYGHGIGMCQTGARVLSTAPFNFKCDQILSHYFPGTNIQIVEMIQNQTASRGIFSRSSVKRRTNKSH